MNDNHSENIVVTGNCKNNDILEGFAGTVNRSFWKAPLWVDISKPAGFTDQSPSYGDGWWKNFLTLSFFFYSPNLIWFSITALIYYLFPYQLAEIVKVSTDEKGNIVDGFSPKHYDWMVHRFLINLCLVFGYVGFWQVTLYTLQWGKRPFKHGRAPRVSFDAKLVHNVWYTFLGTLQWSIWEAIFMYCYATKRLPYLADSEIMSSKWSIFNFIAFFFLVPFYRDLHFYFAHRLLHIKSIYKFVHSLHHRNADIDPFAGLAMHPVEHIYYYSCAALSLYIFASPFAFLWNGVHLIISPAASHSGFEDHFQSDQFHYLHHRYFECNYGTSGVPFDKWFGTARIKMKESKSGNSKIDDTGYTGAAELVPDNKEASKLDTKATLFALPELDQVLYLSVIFGCAYMLYAAAFNLPGYTAEEMQLNLPFITLKRPQLVGLAMSVGPIVTGAVLSYISKVLSSGKAGLGSVRKFYFYPFHKENIFGGFGFHLVVSFLLVVLPVYHLCTTLLENPGNSVGCQIWGC